METFQCFPIICQKMQNKMVESKELKKINVTKNVQPEIKVVNNINQYDDIDDLLPGELNTVNFGIDSSHYMEQVNEMRNNIKNLMNEFESYKEEYQHNIKEYHRTIDERREKYRELCHRYNTIPDF